MKISITALLLLLPVLLWAQNPRIAALKANEARLVYPLYKGAIEMGVIPAEDISYPFRHKGASKLVFDISAATADSLRHTPNAGLLEAMRILNLHVQAGVPKEKIDAVIVFHGPAAASFLNEEPYMKRFKVNNPNLALIRQLTDNGVKLVVCGQTMAFRNFTLDMFPPGTMKALAARTAVSDLQQRGHALFILSE